MNTGNTNSSPARWNNPDFLPEPIAQRSVKTAICRGDGVTDPLYIFIKVW